MTQAFNLSQLANKVNTSGQLDASTGLVNITPVANGGTGKSSVTTGRLLLGAGTSAMTELSGSAVNDVAKWDGSKWIAGAATGSAAPTITTYIAPGNWTLTAAVKGIKVTVVGAGGNGGSGFNQSLPAIIQHGGGGGGGGMAIEYLYAPGLPALPIPISAGPGINSFGSFVSATAGANGTNATAPGIAPGGAGGLGQNGNINLQGKNGIAGYFGGDGGDSFMGAGGNARVSAGVGVSGFVYGGAGAGGYGGTPSPGGGYAGGTGAGGIVIVEEFY